MRKRIALVAALALSAALAFVLVGCGGGGGNNKANFVGSWDLVGATSDSGSEEMSAADFEMAKSMGLTATMTLSEDGKLFFDFLRQKMEGTWEVKSASEGTAIIDGEMVDIKLDGEKLLIEQDGSFLSFVKAGSAATSSSSSSSSSSSTSSSSASTSTGTETVKIDPVTIADDDICTFVVTGKSMRSMLGPAYNVKITNNSDKEVMVSYKYGTFSVADKMIDPALFETIQPGKYVEADMWFDSDDVPTLDDLKDVEGVIEVTDTSSYDTIAEYSFKM